MADESKITEEELKPSETAGYKPPAQKTLDEMRELDKNDESLTKWKEQLLKNADAAANSADPRKVVVLSLAMEVEGRPDVVLDLSSPGMFEYQ
jgi:Rho GDP-dissociation inhibitor